MTHDAMSAGTGRDDASLLRNARRDPEAFGVFYRRHVAAVHAKFARAVGGEQVSLDLTAEVFARALERVHAFRGVRTESAAAWIHAIADRLLLDYYRSGGVADRAVRRLAIQAPAIDEYDGHRFALRGDQLDVTDRAFLTNPLLPVTPRRKGYSVSTVAMSWPWMIFFSWASC